MIQGFKFAIKGIVNHKLRSSLTVLGVVIGIASVIILIGIMTGIQNEIISSYESMGLNIIEVDIFYQRYGLKDSDIKRFSKNNNLIIGYSPSLNIYEKTIDYKNSKVTTTVKGVDVDYSRMKGLNMKSGRFLSYLDIKNNERVCVLGSYISLALFRDKNALNQEIKIDGKYYRVIGIMESTANNERGTEDDQIIISYTNAQRIEQTDRINSVYFLVKNRELLSDACDSITLFLSSHIDNSDYYNVYTRSVLLMNMMSVINKFRIALLGVASISLLVGGIGIMNIMLVNISERRKEIGIRLAVGAVPKNIMIQFLIESITISCAGGLIGLLLGIIVLFIVVTKMTIAFIIPYSAVIFTFCISVLIGIVFGSVPAVNASKVDPIESLRL